MPKIFRFYIRHCLIGFAISGIFTALLMYFNVANLWHLISTSDIGLMALTVFWVLNGIVFAGAQTAVAVLLMTEPEGKDRGGGRGARVPVLAYAQER